MAVKPEKDAKSGHDNVGFDHSHQSLEVKKSGQPVGVNETIQDKKGVSKSGSDAKEDEEIEEEIDVSCGIGSLRTNIFGRRFANLYVFATCMGISALCSSMVHSVIHVQLTSIEKEFNIDNSKAGLFDTVSRAGHMTTILFAGHFAKTVNIPLTIGISGMFQGVLLATPAFLQFADPYELPILPPASHNTNTTNITSFGDQAKYMCDAHYIKSNETHTKRPPITEKTNDMAFITILVVQAVKGITDTFHSGFLPTLYMDDNMEDKSKMSVFLGIQHIITDLASPVGRQINGYLTEIPIDLKETTMDPKDGRFVAAWWLAFLVFGSSLVVVSFPILLFPRKLISKKKQGEALRKAVVTYAGGKLEEDIEKPITDQMNVEDTVRKYSVVTIGMTHGLTGNTQQRLNNSRKNSLASIGQSGSRRPSLFPPVVAPTERKVSLTGDLIFEQTMKPEEEKKRIQKQTHWESIKTMFKDFPRAFLRMLKNPAYILLLADIAIVSIPMSGTAIFRSAYMANQYNVPMSEVTLASGISSAIGHVIGTVMSSWLASKVNTRMGYLYIVMSSYIITTVLTPLYIVFGCGNDQVYGAVGEYGVPVNLTGTCDCSMAKVLISCGDDGKNYLSPCHAGCTGIDGKLFTNCSLLTDLTNGNSVHPGLCPTNCHTNFIIYVLLHGIQNVASSSAMIPRRLLILRIVDPRDRAFATSIFVFFSSLMAIPAPNFFGKMIDDTCLVWDGKFCSLYDRDKIRYFLSGIDVGVHVVVQLTWFLMLGVFKWQERKLNRENAKKSAEQKDLEMEEKT